jgi:hypothetical protein
MEQEKKNQEGTTSDLPKRRKWTRRKNPKFKLPLKAPEPVKALWDAATLEEKQKAHQAAVAILEIWMGQSTRQEMAQKLEIPPLRVWQMSQQALVGLVAGLLKQPKAKKGSKKSLLPPEEDPNLLQKRIASLERDLAMTKELVGLLKEFPAHREAKPGTEADGKSGKKKKPEISPGTNAKDGKDDAGGGA